MIDSLQIADSLMRATTNGGFIEINWWYNIIYYILGLLGTFIYFWAIIRAGTVDSDTFKEFFSIKKNQNNLYLHLILYHALIVIWLLDGLYPTIFFIGEIVKFALSFIGMDLTERLRDIYTAASNLFPKGQLSGITFIIGGGLNFFIRNIIPAAWKWIKKRFNKGE